MKYGLNSQAVTRIQTVLSHYPEVEKAVLYGSRAKGNYHPGSDIDLTLLGDTVDQHIVSRIAEELDDLLLPYRIDLSIFRRIRHPELLEHIRRVGVIFYKREATEARPSIAKA